MNSTLKQHSGDQLPADKRADTAPSAHDVDEIERFLREEFEPRLSAQQQQGGPVDPLMAELARIVGQEVRPVAPTPPAMPRAHDPFSVDLGASKPLSDADINDPLRAFEEELRRFDAAHGRAAPTPEPEVAAALEAPADPYAVPPPVPHIEPDLRLSPANEAHYTHAERDFAAYPDEAQRYDAAPDLSASREVDPALEPQGVIAEDLMPVVPPPAPRSRKVMYLLGGAAAFALTGVIGSIAFGNKTPKPNEIPVIAAKTQPAKEKPADPGGVEVPGQDRQVLARKVDEPAKAAAVVTKEEQPVDLNQTPKRDVARVVLPAPGQGNAPAQPVIMPQGAAQPPAAQPAAGTPPPATAGGFEAKRVRSVKIGGEGEAAAAAPAAPAARPTTPSLAAAPAPVPAPVAAAPKVEPPKVEAPKSDARPTTVARPAPTTTTPQPARTTPPRPATPQPAAADDGDAPMSLRPPSGAQPRPTRTAAATPAAPATPATSDGGGGGFAVQLAAPGSEAEARATANRLKQRYADALDGYSPGVRKADVSGKTVYRVRVGGLSRQDANELCTRIKSDGGSCFVASN